MISFQQSITPSQVNDPTRRNKRLEIGKSETNTCPRFTHPASSRDNAD